MRLASVAMVLSVAMLLPAASVPAAFAQEASASPNASALPSASAPASASESPNPSPEPSGSQVPDAVVEMLIVSIELDSLTWPIDVTGGRPSVEPLTIDTTPGTEDDFFVAFNVAVFGPSAMVDIGVPVSPGWFIALADCTDSSQPPESPAIDILVPGRDALAFQVVPGVRYSCFVIGEPIEPEVPGPDLTRTFVSAWSAVPNPNPARGGPLLLLDGWRFRAAFESATVVRSQTVTHITVENANPAFWEIAFTDPGPTRAVVTVVPHSGARLLDVRCVWQIKEPPLTEHRVGVVEGNSVSFEVGRGVESEAGVIEPQWYDCYYIYSRGIVPATDAVPGAPASKSHGSHVVLTMLAGLVAGALVFKSTKRRRTYFTGGAG